MEENKVATDSELKQKSREIVAKFFNICDAKNESSADITWLVQNIFVALVAVRDQQQRTDYAATRAKAFNDAAAMVDAGSGKNNRRDIIRELQYVARQALEEEPK